ncbi:mitochondrial tRNA-specific 2-thiouridylase Slm3 [Schizosaccharomyces pombe]|uniref:Mitochondrial tRNA-specific 2-thiouridylase 1 n=1 Tax=Schizosaccharomyces pombe (strain 972 / ATCC 24843) TaxID=284812 RepID=MTU1_SCHPO|nr:tRNA (5-methylaminomethyl-2-thiouridylate)-methyltransferase [Schizosaccharomyces pombe]O13947.1 RecName: Full=Mitochondrial tRNA-specific 2-thiouridylase 1 [Schizosaccharomyces pombe 972h-]CAB11659.1 mitochondrial tRNA(5-methylaminomethyl-2-thiouridylate)-methyltransferase (predicted) [Schizosaccharomyces pombe]|eukprot:NP_593402.1 tRNA (5-methylaminomethyl-2-thiouridylate)-methyltransferase [Schizosaccharomyces pombe]
MRVSLFLQKQIIECSKAFQPHSTRLQWPKSQDKVFVAMSGGVDSSFSAYLLKSQGYNVEGVFMRNWLDEDSAPSGCPAERDWATVQKVCKKLNISCRRFNFEKEYWNLVFEPSLDLYENGLTPNPDVSCNRQVKFGALFDALKKHCENNVKGDWWLASGHYAKSVVNIETNESHMCIPTDKRKDQTLFLCTIRKEALEKTIFPLHNWTKENVKKQASSAGFKEIAEKQESQGLCFVSPNVGRKFRKFLQRYLNFSDRPIKVIAGKNVVGEFSGNHGIWSLTVGERCGLSLPQAQSEYFGRWYVWKKDIKNNALYICRGTNNELLMSKCIYLKDWKWCGTKLQNLEKSALSCFVRVRHQQPLQPAKVTWRNPESVKIHFQDKQRAVTPGQVIAVYVNDVCLGGGMVDTVEPEKDFD